MPSIYNFPMKETIIIRVIFAPTSFRGCVRRDAEGNINMYLNGNLSRDEFIKAYNHEMRHVELGHLDDDCLLTTEEKERQADECGYLCEVLQPPPTGAIY